MFGLAQQAIIQIHSSSAWHIPWKRSTYLDLLFRRQKKSLLLVKSLLLCFQKVIPLPQSIRLPPSALGKGSDSIAPVTENVTLQIGSFSLTIKAGRFRQDRKGTLEFEGVISSLQVEITLQNLCGTQF